MLVERDWARRAPPSEEREMDSKPSCAALGEECREWVGRGDGEGEGDAVRWVVVTEEDEGREGRGGVEVDGRESGRVARGLGGRAGAMDEAEEEDEAVVDRRGGSRGGGPLGEAEEGTRGRGASGGGLEEVVEFVAGKEEAEGVVKSGEKAMSSSSWLRRSAVLGLIEVSSRVNSGLGEVRRNMLPDLDLLESMSAPRRSSETPNPAGTPPPPAPLPVLLDADAALRTDNAEALLPARLRDETPTMVSRSSVLDGGDLKGEAARDEELGVGDRGG